jgi:serine/threonine protein kinase/Tol biopolymer transport system component
MTPERWRQIDHLFHVALGYEPAQRADFLISACGDDESLRQEVESLLSSHQEAESFIETPPGDMAVGLFHQSGFDPGEQINNYRIVRQLGSGGMGEVYLAQDVRLGRNVALKILPAQFTMDPQRVRRFEQEARAASALNHPNIITIHESGRINSTQFIATEFVDGVTLREHLGNAEIALTQLLDVAVQIASALAAAHVAGIVHRDIKPENVMLRPDGFVKVLDFGLAKLVSDSVATMGSQAPTKAKLNTTPGLVMGTVHYMSPEQARGQEVDARTDIWSLGVVLYEMTAGRAPFKGESPSDVISLILQKDPPPLKNSASEQIPAELDWIITKTLRKDPGERYQTSKELLIDLQRLRQQLEIKSHVERSAPREASGAATTARVATRLPSRRVVIIAAVLIALMLGALAYVWRWKQQTALSFQTAKFARLTSTGKALGAAISPDGKWLVHVQDDGGQQSLWLQQVAIPNSNTQIVAPADVLYWGLAFSPDGNYIYYTASEKTAMLGSLYQMPVLGGPTRKLTMGANGPVAFSPDGKQIAYFAFFQGGEEDDKLMIANADGTGSRELAVRRGDEYFFNGVLNGVSWSPDGKTIVTPVGNHREGYMSVAAVSVASGEVKLLTPRRWRQVRQVVSLGDGSRLLVTAQEQGADTYNIWQLSYPTGEAQKLTNDLNSYFFISLTADARLLAAVQIELASNIWVLPAFDAAQAKPITQGRNNVGGPSWTPDGRIVYSSNASGNNDLYAIDARGGDPKQLTTSPGSDRMPAISPDGRYVVFASDRAGRVNLWRMDIDGANAKQLTDKTDWYPALSPDGRWVAYSLNTYTSILWKLALDGGQPQQITEKTSSHPSFSPDGKRIACIYQQEANGPLKLAILSFADGQLIKAFDPPAGLGRSPRWTADGRTLIYHVTVGGVSNLWAQPVDGGPPKQLTNFTAERIFGFDISRDGKQLALSRGTQASDVVLISDFK